jgi:hypothetical protein
MNLAAIGPTKKIAIVRYRKRQEPPDSREETRHTLKFRLLVDNSDLPSLLNQVEMLVGGKMAKRAI